MVENLNKSHILILFLIHSEYSQVGWMLINLHITGDAMGEMLNVIRKIKSKLFSLKTDEVDGNFNKLNILKNN